MTTDDKSRTARNRSHAAQPGPDEATPAPDEQDLPMSLRVTMSAAEQEALRRRLREKFH